VRKTFTLNALSAAAVVMAACTGSPAAPGEISPSPAGPTDAPSSAPAVPVVIECGDAPTATTVPALGENLFHGLVTIEGWRRPAGPAAPAESVGVSTGQPGLYFGKAPLHLAPTDVQVSIRLSPGAQFMAWMPAAVWASGASGVDAGPWMTHELLIAPCDTATDLLGGLVADDPARCFGMTFSANGFPTESRSLTLGGGQC